ncbi:MAG: hypothetical protein J5626_05170, partial [Lachnospiraceae bacterium]|nr:hypothetical protein [Lachnospiraceae bacterium]
MIAVKVVLAAAAMLVAAALMGYNFKREDESTLMAVVYGFIIEWALAFFVATPLVIKEQSLTLVVKILVPLYIVCMAAGLIRAVLANRKSRKDTESVKKVALKPSEIVYLGLFLGIVLFELYKTIFYAYADGDDAFYVATAKIAEASDRMYLLDAYIGIPTEIPYRYAFAPFPIWIAALARISGIDSTTLSFSVISPVLILVTYFLYSEISKLLFGAENREKRYMFLCLAAIFEMFSNVSTSTSGTFMLTRARQGKEALACIIIPFAFYELFRVVKADGEIKFKDFVILFVTASAASLTSLLGNVLVPIMYFGAGIWMLIGRKKFKNMLFLALSIVVNL